MKIKYDNNTGEEIYYGDECLLTIEKVEVQNDYGLLLLFSNGQVRTFDASTILNIKNYQPLKNKKFFSKVKIECGGLAWNDDIDLDPEYVYEHSKLLDPDFTKLTQDEYESLIQ